MNSGNNTNIDETVLTGYMIFLTDRDGNRLDVEGQEVKKRNLTDAQLEVKEECCDSSTYVARVQLDTRNIGRGITTLFLNLQLCVR